MIRTSETCHDPSRMDLPPDLKELFSQWLEGEIEVANKFSSKVASQYGKALDNLKRYPTPITNTKQLLEIQYIGPKMVSKLNKKLLKYCEENGIKFPEEPVVPSAEGDDDPNGAPKKKRKTTTRKYIPQKRSGGYAILLTLLVYDTRRDGMSKEDIIRQASNYSDQSFHANPATNQFYSLWTSCKTLISKGLVLTKGRPLHYYLTDEGEDLARVLATNEQDLHVPDADSLDKGAGIVYNDNLKSFDQHQYSVWEPGEFDVALVIDNREIRSQSQREYFSTKLKELGLDCSTTLLTVGDGLWIAKHRENGTSAVLDFIMERKRLDDLALSIKDGRYLEQKSRLKKTGIGNVFYIVEETTGSDLSLMGDAIQTSILLNITNSQFFTRRTKDSDDTIYLLHQLTGKIAQYYKNKSLIVIERPFDITSQLDYAKILQDFRQKFQHDPCCECVYRFEVFQDVLSKSDLITVKEMFIKMLMTIKGVSLDKLVMIQKQFPTPRALLEAYEECQDEQSKKTLLSATFQNEIGNKKIGPLLSTKIYEIWGS